MSRLAARLNTVRQQSFCGRTDELALFETTITAPELPFHMLYVYGPDGIGKSTLLQQFVVCCTSHAVPVYVLDGAVIEPEADAVLRALAHVVGVAEGGDPCEALVEHHQRQVILIDTYERCAPLDGWFRNTLLPALPEDTLVVIADCNAPALAWRTDPAWQTLLRMMPLRNLSPTESQIYLRLRDVPTNQHDAVLNFTHGHPLALALVADLFAQREGFVFTPEESPDVVRMLLERLVQRVPGPAHRAALEVCALVHLTTESLLSQMLRIPDVHGLFAWLRGLSFIATSRQGIYPHALVREALATDMRWRNPDWYKELHQRARTYFTQRLAQVVPHEQQDVLTDYIFLHRHNAAVRPFFVWQHHTPLFADQLQPHDTDVVAAMVQQHEGSDAARLVRYWLLHYPQHVTVFRSSIGQIGGFLLPLELHALQHAERAADPATHAAWNYLLLHTPLRPGERATLWRWWMARDTYQSVSPTQSLLFVHMVRHYLTTPGLAFTFLPCADPDFWRELFRYVALERLPTADFVIADRHYGMYGHDWRTVPPVVWLEQVAARALSPETPLPALQDASPIVVLSQDAVVTAVRDALRDILNPQALRHNPLLRSRLIAERTGFRASEAEQIAQLQQTIREACERLRATPQTLKLYRVLYHTYLQPATTQERAAELLDLPFSTYRRHLKAGIAHVAAVVWQHEMGSPLR